MNRRRFLETTATGALGFGVIVLAGCDRPTAREQALAQPDLLSVIGSEEEVRAIGEAYRAQFPEESDREALTAALEADAGTDADALRARVQADFEEGRTVIVNGWVLSRTEARQSALYALLNA